MLRLRIAITDSQISARLQIRRVVTALLSLAWWLRIRSREKSGAEQKEPSGEHNDAYDSRCGPEITAWTTYHVYVIPRDT
jgi:hypothetical protein